MVRAELFKVMTHSTPSYIMVFMWQANIIEFDLY